MPGMNVFSLPSFDDAQRDFRLRFRSPPLLLASSHLLALVSSTGVARYASAEKEFHYFMFLTGPINALPSRLDSFPFECRLLPFPVFIDSVRFLFLSKSRAFAAAMARADVLGPAEDPIEVEVELNKLLKSVLNGSDCIMDCWVIECTVCG